MALFGFGKKQQIKKPLTDPLGREEIAELPPMDSSLPEDRGLPQTPSLSSSDEDFEEASSGKVQRFSMPEFSQENEKSSFQKPYQQPQQTLAKDIELISSKLDYLKAALDSLNQRLANLERIMQVEKEQRYRW